MSSRQDSEPEGGVRMESAADETTPLLATINAGPTIQANAEPLVAAKIAEHDQDGAGHHSDDEDEDRPLPRLQIFLLCYARMVEPIAVRTSLSSTFSRAQADAA